MYTHPYLQTHMCTIQFPTAHSDAHLVNYRYSQKLTLSLFLPRTPTPCLALTCHPPPSPPSPHPIPLSPSICFFPKWTTHIQKLGYFIIVLVSLRKLQNGLGFTCRSQEAGSEESSTVGVWNFSDPSTKVNCNCVKSVVLLCLMSFPASPTFCPSPWIRG